MPFGSWLSKVVNSHRNGSAWMAGHICKVTRFRRRTWSTTLACCQEVTDEVDRNQKPGAASASLENAATANDARRMRKAGHALFPGERRSPGLLVATV